MLWLQHQEAIDSHSAYIDWIYHKIQSLPLPADGKIKEVDDQSETSDDEDGPVYHIAKK
jgi:hypothetical protein